MKKIIIAFLSVFILLQAEARITKIEFQASGLTCSMCSKAIHKALEPLSFIADIKTDLNKNLFVITTKDSVPVQIDEIRKKVEGAGFFIAKLWISTGFDRADIKNDVHIDEAALAYHFMNVQPQTINGTIRLQVLDKGFVTAKEYKKNSRFTQMACYKTGYMESCCKVPGNAGKKRIIHVTI
jgi:copper chaperone CopZ